MSKMTVREAMKRITTASPLSPIALFAARAAPDGTPRVDAVFARTVMTQRLIRGGEPNYIGTFHREMSEVEMRQSIDRLIENRPIYDNRGERLGIIKAKVV